mmetsp:Transcript_57778/g.122925  ORF Transcript_57778/g.122925 Transcript_57778/m.122925 type:complete len:174 (+) Transcript_57778:302-823(+)
MRLEVNLKKKKKEEKVDSVNEYEYRSTTSGRKRVSTILRRGAMPLQNPQLRRRIRRRRSIKDCLPRQQGRRASCGCVRPIISDNLQSQPHLTWFSATPLRDWALSDCANLERGALKKKGAVGPTLSKTSIYIPRRAGLRVTRRRGSRIVCACNLNGRPTIVSTQVRRSKKDRG